MFIFQQNPQFSHFSFKPQKQPHQFKPHQHTNMYKHLWSEFKYVSTIITHQFMIYTQLSKNHQNNLSTTTTMKFKHITQQFHEVYHTQKFTWIRSTKFIIKKSEKVTINIKTLKPIIENRRLWLNWWKGSIPLTSSFTNPSLGFTLTPSSSNPKLSLAPSSFLLIHFLSTSYGFVKWNNEWFDLISHKSYAYIVTS